MYLLYIFCGSSSRTPLWVGLRYVIVVYPDHTHLLFYRQKINPFSTNEMILKNRSFRNSENLQNLKTADFSNKSDWRTMW